MNITDDSHEAIYQSAGNRWTRLEERCTVYITVIYVAK